MGDNRTAVRQRADGRRCRQHQSGTTNRRRYLQGEGQQPDKRPKRHHHPTGRRKSGGLCADGGPDGTDFRGRGRRRPEREGDRFGRGDDLERRGGGRRQRVDNSLCDGRYRRGDDADGRRRRQPRHRGTFGEHHHHAERGDRRQQGHTHLPGAQGTATVLLLVIQGRRGSRRGIYAQLPGIYRRQLYDDQPQNRHRSGQHRLASHGRL